MKPVKMLALAAAAAALMALTGAATASATTLCKNNTTTAKCSATYGPNTVIEGSLKSANTILENTFGVTLGSCNTSTVKLEVMKAGSSTETVSGPITGLTFGGVGCNITKVEAKTFEIHQIVNTDNGTLTAGNFQLSIPVSGETCIYGGTSVDLGTLEGGAPATIKLNGVLNLVNKCTAGPADVVWTGEYSLSAPEKGMLYVAAG